MKELFLKTWRLIIVLKVLAVIGLLFFFEGNIVAKSADEPIRFSLDDSYPPFAYQESEKAVGLYSDLTREIIELAGLNGKVISLPWLRILKDAELGWHVASGLYKTPEREKYLNYTNPYYTETLKVYANKDQNFLFKGMNSLKGKMIAVRKGFSYGTKFDRARKNKLFRVFETQNEIISMKMLFSGRVDLAVMEQYSASKILKDLDLEDKIKTCHSPLDENFIYMGVPRMEKYDGLVEKLNKVITPEYLKKNNSLSN
jgi:polar amino acid transport system substrate-binding protein